MNQEFCKNFINNFNFVVKATPHRIALVEAKHYITYQALDNRAMQLAHLLYKMKISKGSIVTIIMDHCIDLLASLISVMRLGGIVLLLDPKTPIERIKYIYNESKSCLLLTHNPFKENLKGWHHPTIIDVSIIDMLNHISDINLPAIIIDRMDIAYITYTSGSTGKPKGVAISHQAISNYLCSIKKHYKIIQPSHFALFTSISFDLTLTSIFFPLMFGHTLHILDNTQESDLILENVLTNRQITHIKLTPSHLRIINNLSKPLIAPLQQIIVGGEQLSRPLAQSIMQQFGNQVKIINEYGPSETTIGASYHFFDPMEEDSVVPIGKPIQNMSFTICDSNVNDGVTLKEGELYIGGEGVANGYWLSPDLTAASFLPDPNNPGKRIYKTGDLVERRDNRLYTKVAYADGFPGGTNDVWKFIGRIDTQIKLRGYRIELQEIENLIEEHDFVKSCIVSVYDPISKEYFNNKSDNQVICAHIITNSNEVFDSISTAIQKHLQRQLPSYMIPQCYININSVPLTNGGKIDYLTLPKPTNSNLESEKQFASAIEVKIATIWNQVLGFKEELVDPDSNFFELGGDSISAILLVNKCKEQGFFFTVNDLFNNPTISKLVKISTLKPNQVVKQKIDPEATILLSPIQKWFFLTFSNDINSYSQHIIVSSKQLLNNDLVNKVLRIIIQQNDALRLLFPKEFRTKKQYAVLTKNIDKVLKYKVHNILDKKVEQELLDNYVIDMSCSLNIETGPIINIAQVNTVNESYLIFVAHHLVVDAVSWQIIINKFINYYHEIINSNLVGIKTDQVSYREWISTKKKLWQIQRNFKEDHWVDLYKNINNKISLDKAQKQYSAKNQKKILLETGVDDTKHLKYFCKVVGVTIRDLLLAATTYSYSQSGESKILIFLEGHGREVSNDKQINSYEIVGWFTEMYPIIIETSLTEDIMTFLRKVKHIVANLAKNKIGYLESYFYGTLSLNSNPIISPTILFNYLGNISTKITENFSIIPQLNNLSSADILIPYAFEANTAILGNKIILNISYDSQTIEINRVDEFTKHYYNFLSYIRQQDVETITKIITPEDFHDSQLELVDLEKIINQIKSYDVDDICYISNLSPMQEGLLVYEQYLTKSKAYHQQISFTLYGSIDQNLIKKAFQQLSNKYMALRSIFVYKDISIPKQIALKQPLIDFVFYDISKNKNSHIDEIILKDTNNRFNLSTNPPMRIILIRQEKLVYTLIWSFHHILLDGWSLMILFKELLNEIQALDNIGLKITENNSEPEINYYYNWLNSQDRSTAIEYWQEIFLGYEQNAPLPKKINRLSNTSSTKVTRKSFYLPSALTTKLKDFARSNNITVGTLLQSIWGILLINYCNSQDIVFGTVVSGRNNEVNNIDKMVGLFINTIPIRVKVNISTTFTDLVNSIQQQLLTSQKYAFLSPNLIQSLSLQKENVLNSLFVLENYPFAGEAVNISQNYALPFTISSISLEEQTHYDLTITFILKGDWKVEIDYDHFAYDDLFINRIIVDYEYICQVAIGNPSSKIIELATVSSEEKEDLLKNYCIADTKALSPLTIPEIFAIQLKRNPHNTALIQGNAFLSYQELDLRSTYLAQYLLDNGVTMEQPVGIFLGRTFDKIISWLAILKSGAAYVPLDQNIAKERLEYIINDSKIKLIITDSINPLTLSVIDLKLMEIDKIFPTLIERYKNKSPKFPVLSPKNLAYIIYTSGSTGLPKGVAVEYEAIYNHYLWIIGKFDITVADVMLQLLNFAVDTALAELYILLVGGQLVMLENNLSLDLISLTHTIRKYRVTIFQLVPSLLKLLIENKLDISKTIRLLLCGAEVLNRQMVDLWHEYYQNIMLVNIYGLTEACIDSAYYICEADNHNMLLSKLAIVEGSLGNASPYSNIPDDPNILPSYKTPAVVEFRKRSNDESIPIGRPITNTKTYIMNININLTPTSTIGELYIGGIGLARGYYNKPELTADKFIPDPFGTGTRLYRTGDLVKFTSNKNILYFGRADMQVKIRGYRVELGEIEKVLLKYPGIQGAVAKLFGDTEPEKFLCVYFTAEKKMDVDLIRRFCLQKLNNYMVPKYIIQLEKFPLMPNGKIDYDSLIKPNLEKNIPSIELEGLEQELAKMWSRVLNMAFSNISVQSNFFDIGGNSVLLIQLHSYICTDIDSTIVIQDLFLYPTISSLSSYIKSKVSSKSNSSKLNNSINERAHNRRVAFSSTAVKKLRSKI